MKTLLTCYLLLAFVLVRAQNTTVQNQEVSPENDITDLALLYYGIDFTVEQRKTLNEKVVELIFKVDEKGTAELYKINGIQDKTIQDSLKLKSRNLEKFRPRIKNGIPEPSLFFLELVYPSKKLVPASLIRYESTAFHRARMEDFDYIEKANYGSDIVMGLLTNRFTGIAGRYSEPGVGMIIKTTFTDHKKYLYGLSLSTYFNKKAKDYPISTDRVQLNTRSTALFGIVFGKWFDRFNIQAELNYAVQNVTERYDSRDKEWIQFKGWSPGVLINYPIQIGTETPLYYYGSPSVLSHNLNLGFGLRYIRFSQREASALMAELGLSYRMSFRGIKEYRLKN